MLSLEKQERYRNIYKQINHNWRSSVEIFAELAHQPGLSGSHIH